MIPSCSTRIAQVVKRRLSCLKFLALLAAVGLLQGCIIQAIHLQGESTPVECRDANNAPRACTDSDRFVITGQQVSLTPQGTGTCGQLSVDFGDGTAPLTFSSYTLNPTSIAAIAQHAYQTPGTKTIRVRGVSNCSGDVSRAVNVRMPPGLIQSLNIQGESIPAECRDANGMLRPCTANDGFIVNGGTINLTPQGTGQCGQMWIDFGDGARLTVASHILQPASAVAVANHTYQGWPGIKTIRARGFDYCSGDVSRTINVRMSTGQAGYKLGLALPTTAQCNVVPNMPPIRAGSTINIETDGRTLDYGPKPGGGRHVFNASGDSSAVVPTGYLFQHRKKFSLVYKIGSADFQGEAGPVSFTATQTGPLEICTNDNPSYLADNRGAMMLTITVNDVAP